MAFSKYQTEKGSKVYKKPHKVNFEITRKNGLYVIESLGISAKALRIGGNSVVFTEGRLFVNTDEIEHIPHAYKCGEISVK